MIPPKSCSYSNVGNESNPISRKCNPGMSFEGNDTTPGQDLLLRSFPYEVAPWTIRTCPIRASLLTCRKSALRTCLGSSPAGPLSLMFKISADCSKR